MADISFISFFSGARIKAVAVGLAALLLAAEGAEAQSALEQHLRDYIPRVETLKSKGGSAGIAVADLSSGKILFSSDGTRQLVPASVLKIITSVAALKFLGSPYRFPTEVFVDRLPKDARSSMSPSIEKAPASEAKGDGKVPQKEEEKQEQEKSAGNLYVRGYGDPGLIIERLWDIAQSIRKLGVSSVEDLVVDDSLFIDAPFPSGEEPYQAAQSAVALNYNSYAITIAPGETGFPAFVSLTDGAPFDLTNKVRTSLGKRESVRIVQVPLSGGHNPSVQAQKVDNYYQLGERKVSVLVKGSIGAEHEPMTLYRPVPAPAAYFGGTLRSLLEKSGVQVKGSLLRGETPGTAKLLFTYQSKALNEIVSELNHYSSNFIAGQVLYALGQDEDGYFRKELGLTRLAGVLLGLGYTAEDFKIMDASGLDKDNRVSAEQLLKVLLEAYRDFTIAPDFISSLSRFGSTGTLKRRTVYPKELANRDASRFAQQQRLKADGVWGKTGTLAEVSSLAGYLETRNGRRMAFVSLINGVSDKTLSTELEDDLVRALIAFEY